MIKTLIALIISILTVCCDSSETMNSVHPELPGELVSKSTTEIDDKKISTPKLNSPKNHNPEGTVAIPSNIAGTYLACHETKAPQYTDADQALPAIGCAFFDENTNTQIHSKKLAQKIQWSYDLMHPSVEDSSIISIEILSTEQFASVLNPHFYEVYFKFQLDGQKIDELLANLRINFLIEDLSGNEIQYRNMDYMQAGEKLERLNVEVGFNPKAVEMVPTNEIPALGDATESLDIFGIYIIDEGNFFSTMGILIDLPNIRKAFVKNIELLPQHVFLACFHTDSPRKYFLDMPISAIGCGFYNRSDGSRIPVTNFAERVIWKVEPTETQQNESYLESITPSPDTRGVFDVYYIFAVEPAVLASDLEGFTIAFIMQLKDSTE